MRRTRVAAVEDTREVTTIGDAIAAEQDGPTMAPGYERIIGRVFTIDEWATYERLEEGLKLGVPAHRAEYATVLDAMERAEDNAREAHRLYVNAVVAREAFEMDAKAIEGEMREQVRAELEAQKERGERKKQITEGDIEAAMHATYPDEYRSLRDRRTKAEQMCEHLLRLADLWKGRCTRLDTMVGSVRR